MNYLSFIEKINYFILMMEVSIPIFRKDKSDLFKKGSLMEMEKSFRGICNNNKYNYFLRII